MTTTTTTPTFPRPTTPFMASKPDAPPEEIVVLFCDEHWAPYQADHTLNGREACRRLMDHLMEDPAFQTACGRDDSTKTPADVNRIYVEGAKLGAICCHLKRADEVLTEMKSIRERAMEAITRAELARQPIGGHRTSRPGGS